MYRAKNKQPLTFGQLDIGDQFVFLYEVRWAKRLKKADKLVGNRKLPYILAFIKTGEFSYKSFPQEPVIDNRKDKIINETLICSGYTHKEAEIFLVE
jgi:hypothetical protein